jgi:outer membrane protein OmpA-like peptidoglycan-associated protein
MIADDIEKDRGKIRKSVETVLSASEIIECPWAFKRKPGLTTGKIAVEEMNKLKENDQFVDVLIADSLFVEDGPYGPLAGKELIEEMHEVSTATRFLYITRHLASYEEKHGGIPNVYTNLPQRIPAVKSVPKNILQHEEKFRKKLEEQVEDWTRHMVRFVSPRKRGKVRKKIRDRDEAIAGETVTIRGETWRVADLCPTYFSGSNIEFQRLRDLFSVDLTLAFSRAFGIWGLKAITHNNDKYFPDDAEKITNKAQQQLKALKKVVENAPDDTISSSVQQSLENFQIPDSPDCFDRDLRKERRENFQFQGEANRGGISEEIADVLEDAAGAYNVELTSFKIRGGNWTESSVELHVPVHKRYRDQFETLFESITRKAGEDEAEVTFWNYRTGHSEHCEGCEARIHENCIVIRNEGNAFERESITGRDPGTVVNCFSSANFGSFGKFYLAASPDGEEPCELFDCTFSPATKVSIEEVFAESPKIREQLMNPGRYVTYYLFIFSCWRPNPKKNS